MESITGDEIWPVVGSFLSEFGPLSAQINSYDEMITTSIPEIIRSNNTVTFGDEKEKHTVIFGDIMFRQPVYRETTNESHILYPMECLYRGITYGSEMFVNVTYIDPTGKKEVMKNELIGIIPVMTKSCLCNLSTLSKEEYYDVRECVNDQGGYFITKGMPRIILDQERTSFNLNAVYHGKKKVPKFSTYAEVRSTSTKGAHSTVTTVGYFKNKEMICVSVPYLPEANPIPLGVIFCALGMTKVQDMFRCIFPTEESMAGEKDQILQLMTIVFEASFTCKTTEQALLYIGRKGKKNANDELEIQIEKKKEDDESKKFAISYAKHLLTKEFLPHMGREEKDLKKKAFYIGYMTRELILTIFGKRNPEDRDHFMNKRISCVGPLLSAQFFTAWKKIFKTIQKNALTCPRKDASTVISWIRSCSLTESLCGCIHKNMWTSKSSKSATAADVYERYNFPASLVNGRKICTPLQADNSKIIKPRTLHASHKDAICPSDTPEGKGIGLKKNKALSGYITIGTDASHIIEIIRLQKIFDFRDLEKDLKYLCLTKIFVNGEWIGMTSNPDQLISTLRRMRRNGDIHYEISISRSLDKSSVIVLTDSGRLCSLLLVVEDGKLKITRDHIDAIQSSEISFTNLLMDGIVEFVDMTEKEQALVCTSINDFHLLPEKERKSYDYVVVDPSLMYGVGASVISFPHCNQAPRNSFECSMGKQATGVPFINYTGMMTGTFNILDINERPLVQTRSAYSLGLESMPCGQNLVVAIMPFLGLGQEDSVVLNKTSVEMGMFRKHRFVHYTGIATQTDRTRTVFGVPDRETCNNFQGNPRHLGPDGLPKLGSKLRKDDIILGMIVIQEGPIEGVHRKPNTNASLIFDKNVNATIQAIQKGKNADGYEYIHIQVIEEHPIIVGDKVASCHAQKGTCGAIIPKEDLPFDPKTGLTPDLFINPLAFPGRMTIGQLIEALLGLLIPSVSLLHKVGAKDYIRELNKEIYSSFEFFGRACGDSTPFRKLDVKQISEELEKYGLNKFGEFSLICGTTGEKLHGLISMGIVRYQRLKHIVKDKIHSRARGPKTSLTKQPSEGRKLGGGLKTGTMERDCLIAQGASGVLKDRLMEQSDMYSMWICGKCGLQVVVNKTNPIFYCNVCCSDDIKKIDIPYGTKLVTQEMLAMNIASRFLTTERKIEVKKTIEEEEEDEDEEEGDEKEDEEEEEEAEEDGDDGEEDDGDDGDD